MTLRKQAAAGVKWTASAAAMNALLNFMQTAVLARLLNPTDFGLMSMVMVVVGFSQMFGDMGVSNAIIYRQDTSREQLSSLYWLNILAGLAVFLVVVASAPLIAAFYGEPRLKELVLCASVVFLITPLGQQFQILFQKELQFEILAWAGTTGYAVNAVVAITLAWSGAGVYALVLGQLANTTTRALILAFRGWKRWRPALRFKRSDLKGYLSFGLYQMGDNAASFLNSYLIQILLGSLLGARALGYYTLAFDMVFKPVLVINPIVTRVAFPVFAKIRGEREKVKNGYLKILRVLSFVNFPLTMGIAGIAPLAVPLIYGEKWVPSIILVQILAFVALLNSTGNPMGALLLSSGRADLKFWWNLGKLVVLIPVFYLGTKLYGVVGAAGTYLVVQCIMSVLAYSLLIRRLLGACLAEYIASMWPSLWMSVLMLVAVMMVKIIQPSASPVLLLVMQIVGAVAVYALLVFVGRRGLLEEVKGMVWNRT